MVGNLLTPITFDQTPLWNQELTMLGVNAHGMENYQGNSLSSFALAMEMIEQGRISLDGFITHRFALDDYREAFQLVRDKPGRVIKVIFEIRK
jgi:threonine dehydrogenase-like Zn-dependent dehydrogenase